MWYNLGVMKSIDSIKKELLRNPEVEKAYNELKDEFMSEVEKQIDKQ